MRSLIARLGPIDEPVLIFGPFGTDKEKTARLIHEASPRADQPFVPVNCAVLSTSSDLAHDQLFGHKAGAYAEAKTDGAGAFTAADKGTLFLDEVTELPLAVQPQLLRAIEEGQIYPLGTIKPKPTNVRIIAATSCNPADILAEGRFLSDLYYCLNLLYLILQPLRKRREDLRSIAAMACQQFHEKGRELTLSPDDWQAVEAYDWPCNDRQFFNILKRAAYLHISVAEALAEEVNLSRLDEKNFVWSELGTLPLQDKFWPADVDSIIPEAEVRRTYMRRCLELCDGSWTKAAQKLGLAPNTLRKWLDA